MANNQNMDFWNSCAEAVNRHLQFNKNRCVLYLFIIKMYDTIYLYAVIYWGGGDFKVSD